MKVFSNGHAGVAGAIHSLFAVRFLLVVGWGLLGYFVMRVALLGSIGADVRAFQLALCVGFIGYLALSWTVWLTRDQRNPGAWRWWLFGCIALRLVVAFAEPGNDANRYVWEGRVQLAGLNPFTHPPNDPRLSHLADDVWKSINHPGYTAIYGPVAQLEFLCAAAVRPSVHFLKWIHVVWDVLVVVVLAACLRRLGRRPHWAILYGLCPLVLTAFAIEGHVDSLMLLFVVLTAWAVAAKRMGLAGAMLGLAIATKMVPVILLPWFMIRHRRAAGLAVLVAAVSYIPYLGAGSGLFSSLVRFASGGEFMSMLGALGVTSLEERFVRVGAAAILIVILPALAWRRDDYWNYAAAANGALLMLMPVVHYWYLSWVLLCLPFTLKMRWIAAAAAMTVYFEAELRNRTVGVWQMPDWAPLVVWSAFAITWLAEFAVMRWLRRRVAKDAAPPVG